MIATEIFFEMYEAISCVLEEDGGRFGIKHKLMRQESFIQSWLVLYCSTSKVA